jgi:hypothetical protein
MLHPSHPSKLLHSFPCTHSLTCAKREKLMDAYYVYVETVKAPYFFETKAKALTQSIN